MDVGCYCVSGSRLVAGAEPARVFGAQTLAPSGVDRTFSGHARLSHRVSWPRSSPASPRSTVRSRSFGSEDNIVLPDPWLAEPSLIRLGGREIAIEADDPYRLELDDMGAAILGQHPPLLGRADALGQARTIEALYRSAASGQPVELGAAAE